MNPVLHWIWLSLACTPGSYTFGKLIEVYKDATEIYEADAKRIASVIGYKNSDRTKLEDKDLEQAEKIFAFCNKFKVDILTYADSRYPEALRRISNPPVLLYCRGVVPDFNSSLCVATVGTRSLSDYGRKNGFKISFDLAKAGATIVSGMAIGIDAVCMAGALAAGGRVVSVIGSGIDVCYPPQHLTLARSIVKQGCVITEFAPGTQPSRYNFPKRNRIISGLCDATLVVEGEERSGALITARCAKEQEREVFAVPGNIASPNSQLSNLLIKNGAKICTRAEDILNLYIKKYPGKINLFALTQTTPVDMMSALREYEICAVCPNDDIFIPSHGSTHRQSPKTEADKPIVESTEKAEVTPPTDFDKKSLKIYKKIPANEACSLESLVDDDMNLREVMSHLLKLEIGGFVRLLPGEMVTRKFK